MEEIVIAIIGSGALSAVISGIFSMINKRKEKKSATGQAVNAILWDRLDFLCRKYINEGGITSEDLHRVLIMFDAYKGLGGNGYMDTLIDNVKKLPIKRG